jgi:secondary thiamine-phosphate synthase enzyme
MNYKLKLAVGGQGLYDVTHKVAQCVRSSRVNEGLVTVFVRHTSASLVIQENADARVQHDLEGWMSRFVSEGDGLYTHVEEGPDDMPAHIKSALTPSSLSIPLQDGAMMLGAWQGIYLWEHRHTDQERKIIVSVMDSC